MGGSFIERDASPLFGGFQASNIQKGKIVKVHTDRTKTVTLTVDVVVGQTRKERVPILFPLASSRGSQPELPPAGIFYVPNVGDECLLCHVPGNQAYVMGSTPTLQVRKSVPSVRVKEESGSSEAYEGTFNPGGMHLEPGAIEMLSNQGNRLLLHPSGINLLQASDSVFSVQNPVRNRIDTLTRSYRLDSAGGSIIWEEGTEQAKRSMAFSAEMFTKSSTPENIAEEKVRGGSRLTVQLKEQPQNTFLISLLDANDRTGTIGFGQSGITISARDGASNESSLLVAPTGYNLIAGNQAAGPNVRLILEQNSITMAAYQGTTPVAAVIAESNGQVTVEADNNVYVKGAQVNVEALGEVNIKAGRVGLGLGGRGVARQLDQVSVKGVESGSKVAIGQIDFASFSVYAAD